MWNTGARIMANGLDLEIEVIDWEDPRRRIVVPSRTVKMWDGTIFPWCDNDQEANDKALKVFVDNGHVRYAEYFLFQVYSTDRLAYYKNPYPNAVTSPAYSERLGVVTDCQGGVERTKQSNVDIFIMKSHVWAVPAGNNEAAAQQMLDTCLAQYP